MPSITTIQPGDIVTLHLGEREFRAQYRCHNERTVIVEVYGSTEGVTFTMHVDWDAIKQWIADRVTDEAFHLPVEDDPVLETIPPERE